MYELCDNKIAKYKQLATIERGKIEAYLCEGKLISWISRKLTRSKSTIFNEIKRGKYNGKYKAHIAKTVLKNIAGVYINTVSGEIITF